MRIEVDGRTVRAGTGAVPLDASTETVVLVHGAGMDRTAWAQQTRWLAHRGYAAVAVDLPGHGGSAGPALMSIEDMADWLMLFVGAAGLTPAHLVGHSMGSLVALAAAARHPGHVRSLVLLAVAESLPVHPDLIAAARAGGSEAPALMMAWGHGFAAHAGGHPAPGQWMLGAGQALVERCSGDVLATDLEACDRYSGASEAAVRVRCPATVVAGSGDRMTPPAGGRALSDRLGARWELVAGVGHMLMVEDPATVRRLILAALTRAGSGPATVEGH